MFKCFWFSTTDKVTGCKDYVVTCKLCLILLLLSNRMEIKEMRNQLKCY